MPNVKIIADVFERGVRVHSSGDIVELDDATAAKAVRREWGLIVASAPVEAAPVAEPVVDVAPKGKKARG